MIPAEAVEVSIVWNELKLSWEAVCKQCKECVFILPHESSMEPDRPHIQHVCFGGKGDE